MANRFPVGLSGLIVTAFFASACAVSEGTVTSQRQAVLEPTVNNCLGGQEALSARWESSGGSYASSANLTFKVENVRSSGSLAVGLQLVVRGLDNRSATVALSSVTVEATTTSTVLVPIASLPVQPVGSQAFAT